MRLKWGIQMFAVAVSLSAVCAFAGTAGQLDTAFDLDGVAVTDGGVWVNAVAVQSDGKVIVAGSDPSSAGGRTWLIRRYTTSGALDTSFGVGGVARPFGTEITNRGLQDLTLDSADRVVATGMAPVEIEVTTGKGKKQKTEIQTVVRFATIRLDTSGELDTAFGDAGVVLLDVSDLTASRGTGIAVQPDGRMVVVGYGNRTVKKKGRGGGSSTNHVLFVTRLAAEGSLDTGFGSNGFTTNDLGEAFVGAIGLQSDGKIVVGSWDSDSDSFAGEEPWALSRYLADGSVDSAFGTRLAPDDTFVMHRLVIDASDRILVGGYARTVDGSTHDGVVVRYASGGALDTSFGVAGTARVGFSDRNEGRGGVALQADGRILLAGSVIPEAPDGTSLLLEHAYLARFDADGDLDATFGTGGIAVGIPIADRHFAQAAALAPNGSIHVAGIVAPVPGDDTDRDWFIARFCD